MADLKAQEIFATGEHNGLTFTEADLDAIAKSFDALNLADRVPLKAGHDSAKDGAPAWGWVRRVYRQGSKLLADFAHVPDKVMQLIKDKAYRYVSVELLKDVKAGTRTIPWTLDAVALLGADQPAVGSLRELGHNMSSRAALVYAGRQCFTRSLGGYESMSDIDNLRAENARLQQQMADEIIRNAINNHECAPSVQVSFARNYRSELRTPEVAKEWVRLNRLPEGQRRQTLQTRGTSAFDADEGALDEGASNSQKFTAAARPVMKLLGYTQADLQDASKHLHLMQEMQQRHPELWVAHARSPAES